MSFAFGFEDVGDDFIGGGKIVGLDGFIEVGDEAEEFIDGGLVIGEKLWTIFGGDFVDGFGGFGASGGGSLFHFGDEGEGGVFLGGIGELFLDGFEGFADGLHAFFEWGVVGAESGDGEDGEKKEGEDFHVWIKLNLPEEERVINSHGESLAEFCFDGVLDDLADVADLGFVDFFIFDDGAFEFDEIEDSAIFDGG